MIEQNNYTYPRHDIDPKLKTAEWGKLYAKAMWYSWNNIIPRTCFSSAASKYEELRLYAQGKQPINKYKKLLDVDQQVDDTFLNLDYTPRPFVVKLRDIAISRLMQQEYNIVATPIDPEAKGELTKAYATMKAKIAIRQLMQQQNPELAGHPMLAPQAGDPMDFEELEMRMEFGEQFNRSKDAEEAIQLGFSQNNIKEYRKRQHEILWDCGVIGYKEWAGPDGLPQFREINPESIITNYCRFGDFRDLTQAAEIIDVALVDMAALRNDDGSSVFSDDDLEVMRQSVSGRWTSPNLIGFSSNYFKYYDKTKVKVLDCRFYSWNDMNYENNVNRRGNIMFNEAPYSKRNNVKNKYFRKRIKVVYECKWVIGTEFVYDFRLMKDMKRSSDPKKMAETDLGYRFYAPNFYEMRATGMMERLLPIIDSAQLTIYRMQNWKARMVPSGWWIDLDALENVALNKAGENMTPKQLLRMFHESGILVGRSKDIMGNNVNYKPVIPISNTNTEELTVLYNDLQFDISQMLAMIGLNELTDATTPNAKTLNGVANLAVQSTNNALYQMQMAEKHLLEKLANDVMMRMQQAAKRGQISGYAPALNSNTLKFMEISPDISLREFGIMLEEKPDDEQKQFLMQNMQADIANGMLDTSDAIQIMNVYNIKQAQQMLAYKVKKNKQALDQNKMALQQQQMQGQQQAQAQAAQTAAQTLQMEYQLKMQLSQMEKQWDYRIAELKMGIQQQINTEVNQAKIITNAMGNQTKENMQKREQGVPEPQIQQPAQAPIQQQQQDWGEEAA